jgi:O-antigen ligase
MAGISGAPNTLGYIGAFCLLALYYYRTYLIGKIPLWFWSFVAINGIALLASNSRTSLASLMGAIMIAHILRFNPALLAGFFIVVCTGIIVAFNLDYDALFTLLSRTGDPTEITTGTNRSMIWAESLRLIAERPVLGWGYASAVYVLPAHSNEIGFAITQAHNAFLQILLTTGIVGLALFLGTFAVKAYFAFKAKDSLNIAFILFLMFVGIMEPIAFGGTATTSTLVLATVLSLRYRTGHEADYSPHQQRLSGRPEAAQDARDLKPDR